MNLRDAGIYDITNLFTGEATRKHSGAATSGSIVNREKSRIINIPAYQRPYRWDKTKIDTLFEDYYSENSGEYFLGSAVAVEKAPVDGVVSFDLVDGQQRVTTLYLLNYIRFLLLRYRINYIAEKIPDSGDLSDYFKEMCASYIDFVGKKNEYRFNELKAILSSLNYVEKEKKPEILQTGVKKWLCIAEEDSTSPDNTILNFRKSMEEFFSAEELSLSYSRKKCIDYLKSALCRVYLIKDKYTTQLLLEGTSIEKDDPLYNSIRTYLAAIECLYSNIVAHAKDSTNELETVNHLIDVTNELVENLSLCIVVTNNEDDANKLFEVLNDRALDMEDLELIKNHFYKEYYTKSPEAKDIVDKNIEELDALWVDTIFSGLGDAPSNAISFFATVYFTSKKEIDDKRKANYKKYIDKEYTKKVYNDTNPYTYDKILQDFYVYYAVKILLKRIQYYETGSNMERTAIEAQKDNTKSITYKTLCLLGEKKQKAVMAGIINMILAYYWHLHPSFTMESYNTFLDGLFNDSTNRRDEYKNIHLQSRILRIASIKCKDYKIPRGIAVRIIESYGAKIPFDEKLIEMTTSENDKLKDDFRDWYHGYYYSSGNSYNSRLKILFLDLLSWTRTSPAQDAYKSNSVKIRPSACSYQFDANLLHLDHLEPQKMSVGVQQYFMKDSEDERLKILNNNIGNFMILDAKENIEKQNDPMIYAVEDHYEAMKDIWLVQDIFSMMKDKQFFDLQKGIPKEEYFKFRTERLYKYFDAILNADLYSQGEEITF